MGKAWKNAGKAVKAEKKGRIFTKLAREILVAAKLGGVDPEGNARLKAAISEAKSLSCPNDTIERALKRASGDTGDATIEEKIYEAFGPHQVGIIIECQTDNKNRTVSDLKTLLRKNSGAWAENGSVSWNFNKVGMVEASTKKTVNDMEEEAIEVDASDVETGEFSEQDLNVVTSYLFYTDLKNLETMQKALVQREWEILKAEPAYRPKQAPDLTEEQQKEVYLLLEQLDDFEDSRRVYSSID
ncbi:MAG: YebC/PmpR family DNA-binding transcriptional regulator [Bdellovibrionaceae bacterium]|nr:YebC/PmpR family DNA-binding transcriptional regulator [Pseudobdellovibrionaceae bacterium]